jgi:hypothetical protein
MKFNFFMLTAIMIAFSSVTTAQDIVISEIMYNPPESGSDSLEFIEIYNNDVVAVDITGWTFTDGIAHTFSSRTMIPGEYLVLARNSSAIQNVYGFTGSIQWNGGVLANGGEDIVLTTAGGAQIIDVVDYDDNTAWSGSEADGDGASLVLCDPSSDNTDPVNWYPSTTSSSALINGIIALGSPGTVDDFCGTLCNSSSTIIENGCATYTVPSGDETYTTNGSYMDTILNVAGCDSVITINLTIINPTTGTDVQTACGSYTWIDGTTYSSSNNTATSTIAGGAANGCDSIVTLDLTINNAATGTDVQTACGSYTWIDGIDYSSSNNTATSTIAGGAANGCDSIVTLDLTINNAATGVDVQTACGSYTWIDGIDYSSSNNTATSTIAGGAANGCDSIVTLDLTINNAATGTDVQTACGSYTWIDGIDYSSSNNTATSSIAGGAANGCDSIVTLDLTINNAATGTDVQTACGSYTWIDGIDYSSSNNTATSTIAGGAANGCDSIVTLDLTINPLNDAGVDDSITVCMNEPIDFDTLSSLGTAGTWLDFTNTPVSGVVTLSSIAGAYEYRYIVYTSNNCVPDTANYTIIIDGGCDYLGVNTESMIGVSVYPNPASSILTIQNSSNTTALKVEMLDMNGRVVLVENDVFKNSSKANLVIHHLNKGIYTLRIYDESSQKTFKIVKQ